MKLQVQGAHREEAASTLRRSSRELRKTITMVEELEQIVGLALALAGDAGSDQMLEHCAHIVGAAGMFLQIIGLLEQILNVRMK